MRTNAAVNNTNPFFIVSSFFFIFFDEVKKSQKNKPRAYGVSMTPSLRGLKLLA